MLRKLILGAAASVTALVLLPASAEAQGYYRDGYQNARHGSHYRGGDGYYVRPAYNRRAYRRAARRAYRQGYYAPAPYVGGYYAPAPYAAGYYAPAYRGRGYYRRGCGDGTAGAIVGGAAGALVGSQIARGNGYYRRGGDGTVGAILGGAVGALVGHEIDRSC